MPRFDPAHALLVILAITSASSEANAQVREWLVAADGDFADPVNWSESDAPDTAAESASFPRFGSYEVTFADGATHVLDNLTATAGAVQLVAAGPASATLDLEGRLVADGGDLVTESGAGVSITAPQGVEVGGPSLLRLNSGSRLVTPSTRIEGGVSGARSELFFVDSVGHQLGDTEVAGPGAGDVQGYLSLDIGATAQVDDLSVSTAGSEARGVAQILTGSRLVQTPGSVTTVGAAEGASSSTALLVAFNNGFFSGAAVRVLASGTMQNTDSEIEITESLSIEGGVYRESGVSLRVFGPSAALSASAGGQLLFGGQPVAIESGQTLLLDEAIVEAPGGILLSGGQATIGAGGAEIDAPTTIGAESSLVIESGALAVFEQSLANNGGLITVSEGAEARFDGPYSGAGVAGAGDVQFASAINPGQSPGAVSLGGDARLLPGANLLIEIAGSGAAEHDSLLVEGAVELAGSLSVELVSLNGGEPAYSPVAGDRFPLMSADSIEGGFDSYDLPPLEADLEWRLAIAEQSLTLWVVNPSVPGDYNHDGVVNAADYTAWRDTLGSTGPLLAADGNNDLATDAADYDLWNQAYGPAGAAISIPEPTSRILFASVACGLISAGRRLHAP